MKASTRIAIALGTVVATAVMVAPAGLAMFSTETGMGAAGAAGVVPAGEPSSPITLPALPVVGEAKSDVIAPATVSQPIGGTSESGLDWASFGTGLGAALGMALLAAVVVVTRRRSTAAHT